MTYKDKQRKLQTQKLHYTIPSIFNHDNGFGNFDEYLNRMYVLQDGKNNLFQSIAENACTYFKENGIAWWGDNKEYPTGHLLSSQIQCLNHLFALRTDKESTLKLTQFFDPNIDDVLLSMNDNDSGYISFEFIYENAKLLNEINDKARRGEYCTSIDVFIIAVRNGKKILIPTEWKYTESYLEFENKAFGGDNNKYSQLIKNSTQLKTFNDLAHSCYYYDPFYELMRQTLLVEQMVKSGIASDFLHILVVPSENKDLLVNNYTFTNDDLQTTWRNCLSDQSKFKVIDSKQIRQVIESLSDYSKLAGYLKSRYD